MKCSSVRCVRIVDVRNEWRKKNNFEIQRNSMKLIRGKTKKKKTIKTRQKLICVSSKGFAYELCDTVEQCGHYIHHWLLMLPKRIQFFVCFLLLSFFFFILSLLFPGWNCLTLISMEWRLCDRHYCFSFERSQMPNFSDLFSGTVVSLIHIHSWNHRKLKMTLTRNLFIYFFFSLDLSHDTSK